MQPAKLTLTVEGFGPIREARVTLAPLVVFTGYNNTGKSYLATLIWGLLNSRLLDYIQRMDVREEISARGEGDDTRSMAGATEDVGGESRVQSLNAVFPKYRREFIRGLFGHGEIPCRNLTISAGQEEINSGRKVIFLPAARTGLVLGERALVGGLFARLGPAPAAERGMLLRPPRLPAPVVDFLQRQLEFASSEEPAAHGSRLAGIIEEQVLGGTISRDKRFGYWYTPALGGARLPIHAVSSLVTEMAPFVAMLKSGPLPDTIIFEEPEAHLHMEAQRRLARLLVGLVNTGVQVILTTHSDVLLQQFNILMHLHAHPHRDRMMQQCGYGKDECLDPAMARAYRFVVGEGGTVVEELRKSRYGFIEPLMNQTIAQMADEISEIQDQDDLGGDV